MAVDHTKFTSMIYGIMLMIFFETLRLRYQSPRVSRRGLVCDVKMCASRRRFFWSSFKLSRGPNTLPLMYVTTR